MGDGLRTIRTITRDEALLASARAAAASLEGWELNHNSEVDELLESPPTRGDVILIDDQLPGENVYESCRRLTGITRCRTFVVTRGSKKLSEPIARFCGATGSLTIPLDGKTLRSALDASGAIEKTQPRSEERRGASAELRLPERLLRELTGEPNPTLIAVLTDPETSLFNYEFLCYKLDEEYKRAVRFETPLSCVMLGFEGQADQENLSGLAGIFLQASRDTDILGRFDETSFLFLLPNTGPDGAAVMAARIQELANDQGLSDLVGDPLHFSVGIASFPDPSIERREDLYGRAREAFLSAQREGGGVVHAV